MTDKRNEKRGPLAWMAGNSVAANLLMVVLLVGGLIWTLQIKQEVFPDFDLDYVNITVSYPGASPEEVEQGIILVTEEAVSGLEGINEITSSAREGSGFVQVEMIEGYDIQKLARDIQSQVDRITSFPEEAEDPRVEIASHQHQVISLVLYGDQEERVLREKVEELRDTLLQDPEITQVELSGVRDLEISIEVPQDKLRAYNLTLNDVATKVRQAAVELPGGGIKTAGGEILVRMKERRDYGKQFARIPIISSSDGTQVLLEDIATVIDGFEDTDTYATYNGKRAMMIDVYRVGDQTPLSVADAVMTYLEKWRQTLPAGISIDIQSDRSEVYRQRLNMLLNNGYMGLALVLLLLGLFLEARLAFWVTMGIPISFLGSILFLPHFGVSINMMSMFAFIVALGIVVDDAIVVGENIYSYREKGYPFGKAAIEGVREVAMPVTFSVLTNIVTFMPLLFVPGISGKIFKAIPIVVIIVFSISLVESLFILPAHLGHRSDKPDRAVMAWLHKRQQQFSNRFSRLVRERYGPFLDRVLVWRYLTIAVGLAILIITLVYVKSGRIGITLMERIESDYAQAEVALPYGSAVEKTEAVQTSLIQAARKITDGNGGEKLVKGIFSEIGATVNGTAGSHTCRVRVYLTPADERPLQTGDFVKAWRREVGAIAGLETLVFKSDAGGPGSRAAMSIELSHRDLSVLEAAGAELAEAFSYFPKVKDIDDGFAPGKQQIDFTVRLEGRALGLTARDVASQVRNSFYGSEVLRQQRGRNEVTVMVRLPKNERASEYNLEELMLRTPTGREVPLREAVTMKRGRAYTEIDRRDGRRVITVTADITPPSEASHIISALEEETLPELKRKYAGLNYGFEGRQADLSDSMKSLFTGLMLAMLAVYALLAIPFRSYIQPMIIMVSIPFGIVGAIFGHLLLGYSLSIMSLFGIVALSGVVVNDSLVLIDAANRQRAQGKSLHDAIHTAAITRFRPILLTSLTTFGGLSPIMLETSRQARFMVPMAISLGFGILFATLITLLLVPCFYLAIEDLRFRNAGKSIPAGQIETADHRSSEEV
ncbi:MAG: efflux RND transporter permease subunit [Syntrophales bacterium]|nr:efflux RND transporter permease subunit [Syntrophales bacterium]